MFESKISRFPEISIPSFLKSSVKFALPFKIFKNKFNSFILLVRVRLKINLYLSFKLKSQLATFLFS